MFAVLDSSLPAFSMTVTPKREQAHPELFFQRQVIAEQMPLLAEQGARPSAAPGAGG